MITLVLSLSELRAAADLVHRYVPPTPQFRWELLSHEVGTAVWVKHENATPTGAFKVRGGIVYMERLARERRHVAGVVGATRGNHGQSIAFAGRAFDVPVTIVVPRGNSIEKNEAMRTFGAELIEHGDDFEDARVHSLTLADERGLEAVPSFNTDLVRGVASYALELFDAVPDVDVVYVPIGLGSGICGVISARDALGLDVEVVGVVSAGANAYEQSFSAGRPIATATADTWVDGVACRVPAPAAVPIINAGAARVISVPDAATADAIRLMYRTTHTLPEPAGAIALAGLWHERDRQHGRTAAVIATGCNMDTPWAQHLLAGASSPFG